MINVNYVGFRMPNSRFYVLSIGILEMIRFRIAQTVGQLILLIYHSHKLPETFSRFLSDKAT